MLSIRPRLAALTLALAALASCGYQPALKQGAPADVLTEGIEVAVAGGREGFILEELLLQRLGQSAGSSPYALTARLTVEERDQATPGAGGIDRKSIDGVAEFEIRSAGESGILAAGSVAGTASFSTGAGAVASGAARRDAERRMLTQIADRLYSRLILTAGEWAS